MTDPSFYEWDYDRGVVTSWVRKGECNHCGQCCKDAALITFDIKDKSMLDTPDNHLPEDFNARAGGNLAGTYGRWSETEYEGRRTYFGNMHRAKPDPDKPHLPCSAWIDERCSIQAAGMEKPHICAVWPMAPKDIEDFDECSYTFEKGGEWPISDFQPEKKDDDR